jgi:hypothetical protein
MTTERCERCDREECEAAKPFTSEVRAAWTRIYEAQGHATPQDRLVVEEFTTASALAVNDCRAHAIDWRTRARDEAKRADAAEAELERLREDCRQLVDTAETIRTGESPSLVPYIGRYVDADRLADALKEQP